MYQEVYEKDAGSAKLNIKKVVAGSRINCRLTYKVGFWGIDDSGSMKVLFRIVSDFEEFQTENSSGPNYLRVTSSNKDITIKINSKSKGVFGKTYLRPWSRGVTLNFSGGHLSKGDEVYIDVKNWAIQTFLEKTFEFKVLVDPFATARYVEVKNSPEMEIIPGKPKRLVVIAPSKVKKNSKARALIKLEDEFGNPCIYEEGEIKVEKSDYFDGERRLLFKNGRAEVDLKIKKKGVFFVNSNWKDLKARSNPIVSFCDYKVGNFWADFHAQSEETVGTNSVVDYFKFAKKYAFLDVVSHQGNDFQITKEVWNKINKETGKWNKDGSFVVFPGYEWSGNTPNGGDRNVIYKTEGGGNF